MPKGVGNKSGRRFETWASLLAMSVGLFSPLASAALAGTTRTGLATDASFSVWADSQEAAEGILETSRRLRREIAVRFLGEEIPDGFGPASINVYFSSHEDKASTWLIDSPKRICHMVWIHTTPEKLEASLAHEITHIVLANRYPRLPAFAQEGLASSFDDAGRVATRQRVLQWIVRTRRWPSLEQLLTAEPIPPSNHTAYAVSVSLCEFLLEQGGGEYEKLLEFAAGAASSQNWDACLKRCYGIGGVAELQQRWQRWLTGRVDAGR